ncbi:GTP cyclohydrolase I FolE2 [Planosporangium thailandense]|uniref:GTP cyclohydrolase FolE2 n=1 Tax=Planosporangium thailandense TaxID=765197 RepID=A0ABX0XYF1_9ACTN|nr:GTP cyclohydrolase FolE2 [Planosporangium thailandense]NJC70856.1 GTP cyclohydrolase I FolE2 [Planosporangium thailandense]
MNLEDVQQRQDHRRLPIDEVGISGLRYPITVWDRDEGQQSTIAEFSLSVDLEASTKGAHLSRFVEDLRDYAAGSPLGPSSVAELVVKIRERQRAGRARIEITFPFFSHRPAPVTGAGALMDYQCTLVAQSQGDEVTWRLAVRVPVTSVCPCSKAISDYGAHNQRGHLTLTVKPATAGQAATVWIDDLIDLGEACGSAPVRPLVKRPDERHLTMAAFDNPVFVEDMVRNAADALRKDDRIGWFSVEAVNDESIHNHEAYARIYSTAVGASAPKSGRG